jgi:hypothetical protein
LLWGLHHHGDPCRIHVTFWKVQNRKSRVLVYYLLSFVKKKCRIPNLVGLEHGRLSPSSNWPSQYYWNIVENGIKAKHHNPPPPSQMYSIWHTHSQKTLSFVEYPPPPSQMYSIWHTHSQKTLSFVDNRNFQKMLKYLHYESNCSHMI